MQNRRKIEKESRKSEKILKPWTEKSEIVYWGNSITFLLETEYIHNKKFNIDEN
jgi:hypothetical protein